MLVIAMRFLWASILAGARPGDMLGPHLFEGPVPMPGQIADFPAGMNYAAQQGWIEKLPDNQYRLTDEGYSIAA